MSNHFFEKINYSTSNEDSESERRCLRLNGEDTVLCITGSGSRTLDLLIDNPRKIISIDLNKTQNFLLELKMAAYKSLNYSEFCAFIGLTHSSERVFTFQRIQHALSNAASEFWTNNISLVDNGVLYCGTWEKILKQMLRFSRPRAHKIEGLMNATSLEKQQEIWTSKWCNKTWSIYLKLFSNRFLWKYIIREPGFRLIPKSFNIHSYMKDRLDFLGTRLNMSQSHFANLLFCGEYTFRCILPHHLREENFEIIKKNLPKIEIITAPLSDYLGLIKNEITAFSLSDFSSYADKSQYNAVWKEVINSAKNGAKFCERQFLVKKQPELEFSAINRDESLENALMNSDVSFIYSFCVGHITK